MGARRGLLVEVKRLRVEFAGECLDFVRGERVAADFRARADAEILEIRHPAATFPSPAARRPNIRVAAISSTGLLSALTIWLRKLTSPISGRLLDGRAPAISTPNVRLSPGRTGARQRISSTPGLPMNLLSRRSPSPPLRIRMPPLRNAAACTP